MKYIGYFNSLIFQSIILIVSAFMTTELPDLFPPKTAFHFLFHLQQPIRQTIGHSKGSY